MGPNKFQVHPSFRFIAEKIIEILALNPSLNGLWFSNHQQILRQRWTKKQFLNHPMVTCQSQKKMARKPLAGYNVVKFKRSALVLFLIDYNSLRYHAPLKKQTNKQAYMNVLTALKQNPMQTSYKMMVPKQK